MRYRFSAYLIVILAVAVQAQEISGPLSGTYGPGTYLVIGDLSVEESDSVVLQPGTTFLFQGANNYSFDIYGYFYAVGTASDSIKFKPDMPGSNWTGIDFNSTCSPDCRLEYGLITGSTQSGVDCFSSSPTIAHCSIIDNTANFGGGIYISSAAPAIRDCLIRGNSTAVCGAGIWASSSQPVIENCVITENNAGNSSGGIYCYSADAVITNCVITWNSSYAGAGGIFCRFVEPVISNCIITDNTTQTVGGGINMNDTNARVDHCVIARNSAGISGGGIDIYISTPTISNCTISGNHCEQMGGGIESFDSSPSISNTIIDGNSGYGGIYFFNSLNAEIRYCDVYDNEEGNFTGIPPAEMGILSTVNVNGDSCDQYGNIQSDPLYYATTGDSAFYLTAASPCIDAGDPQSPNDPDGTTADIGMYYYDQSSSPSPIAVTLTPYGAPIQIPAAGGSFDFNIAVRNCDPTVHDFDIWIMAAVPGGTQVGPLLGPYNLVLPASAMIDRDRTQWVPDYAPPGPYTYEAYVGIYPDDIWEDDSFTFEKLETGMGVPVDEWINRGEALERPETGSNTVLPDEYEMLHCYPNPFNAEIIIEYQIQQTGDVRLTIHDVSGREVARYVQGRQEHGLHRITWQPEGLASGVYLVDLVRGAEKATTKILYIK